MTQIDHLEWLTRNSLRDFPLREGSVKASPTGFMVPDDLLVDIFLSTGAEPAGVWLSSVCLSPSLITLVFSSVTTGATLATATAIKGKTKAFVRYPLEAAAENVGGFIAFGLFVDSWFRGTQGGYYGVNPLDASMRLEGRCVVSIDAFPIHSIRANLAPTTITGGAELVARGALTIAATAGTDTDGDPLVYLTFALDDQTPFVPVCGPPGNQLLCPQRPIFSINEVTPDDAGNLEIEFVDFTSITQVANILKASFLATGTAFCAGPIPPSGSSL